MSDSGRGRWSSWAIALTMLYFFGLGAGYLYLTFKHVKHSVVIIGPDPLMPGTIAGFRVLAFSEQTGLPREIRRIEVRPEAANAPGRVLDVHGRVVDLLLPVPKGLKQRELTLRWRVTLAGGEVRLTSRHTLISPPSEMEIELPPTKRPKPPEPSGIEAQYPIRLALSPEHGRLIGNARNRVYLRLMSHDGKPIANARVTIDISGGNKRALSLTTDSLGLAELELNCLAPAYKLRIGVKTPTPTSAPTTMPSKPLMFVRHLVPNGKPFVNRVPRVLYRPGPNENAVIPFQATSGSQFRYCEHYWRGLWLHSHRLAASQTSCTIALHRAGLHFVVLSDHYAVRNGEWLVTPIFASYELTLVAIQQLALALTRSKLDATYFGRFQESATIPKSLNEAQRRRLLGYMLSLVPRSLTPLRRLVDSRTVDRRALEKTRSSGRRWLIRALIASSILLLGVLFALIIRTFFRIRRSFLDQFAEEDELASARPAVRSAADWFPL
ncbi:MAG: Ig-like domain-containing protein, partial [Myxococcales bacterium]|nr:Ig-like domain-containing protein [Myxococcales bacterium]